MVCFNIAMKYRYETSSSTQGNQNFFIQPIDMGRIQ